ncbi:MAG: pyrroline-5-carboxylate reductase [Bacteroidota bacterium]
MNKRITIIGGGNLGGAIAEGLVASGFVRPELITVTRRKLHLIQHLSDLGIATSDDNLGAVKGADIVILAIKPKQCIDIIKEIKPNLSENTILVSVVTGISISDMSEAAGSNLPVFRAMPNTAIAIRESMTCIATNHDHEEDRDLVVKIFEQVGDAIIIEEDLMNSSTVLGACGIAYALRFIRAASQGGIEIGFSSRVAQRIAAQTVKGAASLLLENGLHPEHEIDKVTTPQGCTIAGLNEMEHQGFSSSLIKGIKTSYEKI